MEVFVVNLEDHGRNMVVTRWAVLEEMPRAMVKVATIYVYGTEVLKNDVIINLTNLSCINFVHKADSLKPRSMSR